MCDAQTWLGTGDSRAGVIARCGRVSRSCAYSASVSKVVANADGTRAVSSSYDKTLRVWDITARGGRSLSTLAGHEAPVLEVALAASMLVSGDRGGNAIMWVRARCAPW